jgi:hypothetical protein
MARLYSGRATPPAYDRAVPEFLPGRELARLFYEEAVAPLVGDVPHSAAFLGWGSDVLGFDTERSTDHGWGPRLQLFVEAADVEPVSAAVDERLPATFRGWPVRFGWDETADTHHVEVATLGPWLERALGFDPRSGLSARDWLTAPQQLLLEVTAGPVFRDGLGELASLREALAWYPGEVWLWLLACAWRRLDQEEPFVGRTAEVGDDLGSRILAARLARDVIRLCFLLERRYAPYSKWLGTAFRRLPVADRVGPPLERALAADGYAAREQGLVEAVTHAAARHNELGVTEPVDPSVRLFHGRPFRVLGSGRFVEACLAAVADPFLRSLPLVGGVDQWVDSTDVLSAPAVARRTASVYERLVDDG